MAHKSKILERPDNISGQWKQLPTGQIGYEYRSVVSGEIEILAICDDWNEVVEVELYRKTQTLKDKPNDDRNPRS